MKKILILTIFLGGTSAFSQSFEYGVKGGAGISDLTGDYSQYNKSVISYYIGIFGQYNFNDKVFIKPEVRYSVQGSKEEIGFRSERTLNYLAIPISVGYNITDKLNVSASHRVSFLLNNEYSYDFSSINKYNPNQPISAGTLEEDLSSIDAGLGLSVSYETIQNLSLELEFYKGIYNINKNANIYDFEDSAIEKSSNKSIYTQNFNLGLSYKF